MNRLLTFLIVLIWTTSASADFLGVKQPSETISFFLEEPLDSTGAPGKPDSVHIMTYADNATAATFQVRSTTYPFTAIGIDTLKAYGDTTYVFADQIWDIDGNVGNFELAILVRMFVDKLPTDTRATVQVITDSLNVLASINDSLEAQDGWVAQEASLFDNTSDSVIVDGSALAATGGAISATTMASNSIGATEFAANAIDASTIAPNAIGSSEIATDAIGSAELATTAVDEIADGVWDEDSTGHWTSPKMAFVAGQTSASSLDSTIISNILHRIVWGTAVGSGSDSSTAAQRDIGAIIDRLMTMAKYDTSAVAAFYDFAIWVDDGAANTSTTVGVDGTLAKPVSTLAAARILADSMDIHQYNILNASSFTLAAAHENWVFHDIGHNSSIDLGSQDVDNSTFEELIVTGTQGGTGSISLLDCDIVDLHDFDGEALFCWLVDSLVMDNNSEAFFGNCYSKVTGNGTPTIDFHVASNNVALRNYSGGINIVNMSSNDKLSIEGNGQIIVDASCSNAPIVTRGNFTITDNGSGTVWTDNAVFNVNAVAAYPDYLYKMVVNGSPTTIAFTVASITPSPATEANDFCVGMQIRAIDDDGDFGNTNSEVIVIADFVLAGSTFTVRPGFMSAPNVNDTVFILPARGAVEPSTWTQHELAITATGEAGIDLDNTVGDFETADFEDSVFNAIKFDTDYYDTLTQIVTDNAGSATISDADMAAIADSVWQANLEGHDNVVGSFGDSAGAWGATGAAGGGPRLCSLMVVDATPAAITDGSVSMTSGATVWTADVSGAGFAVFSLTDATWIGLAYATGYVQDTIPQTFVITASVRDTITMTAISISAPSAADKSTCFLFTYNIMGAIVENAKLTATINGNGPWFAADDSTAIMVPKKVSAKTDSNGKAELELWKSAEVIDINGNNPTFNFTLEKSNYFKWIVQERTVSGSTYNIKP